MENCQNYFDFQRRWPMLMEQIWDDVALKGLFSGERRVDRTTITGRFPIVEGRLGMPQFLLAVLVGLAAGILSGAFGVGGAW